MVTWQLRAVTPSLNEGWPATQHTAYSSGLGLVGLGGRTHLHTYSSRGGWVLGVMIQGATRKVTLSVKSDTSERAWERGVLRGIVGSGLPSVPHTALL